MQEIAVLLEDQPELSMEMVELDNRNRQAHRELQLYNDHKTFLYKHPIVSRRKQYDDQLAELYELKRTDPASFLKEITNTTQNIRRITSNLKKKKYKSEEEKQSWEHNLSRAETREMILKEIIEK
jgi:flagellar motility protein MotE (MotC chaperone)